MGELLHTSAKIIKIDEKKVLELRWQNYDKSYDKSAQVVIPDEYDDNHLAKLFDHVSGLTIEAYKMFTEVKND